MSIKKVKSKILLLSILFFFSLSFSVYCAEVIVYTSVDQIFSEPILELFEQQSGIKVKAVYDVEAAKTVGLVNRLIAEQKRPRADVFWSSEIIRTLVLKRKGILTPYHSPNGKTIPIQFKDPQGYWAGFAGRARVIIYNTKLLTEDTVPRSIFELTGKKWQGKVAMAYPLLGTAATHVGGLYSFLGKEKAEKYFQAMKKNKVLIVSGNSVVRDVVAAGEVPLGITDSDDVQVALARNLPVNMIFPDQDGIGTFFIPNTVALINNSPHPQTGKQLIDFLLSPLVEELLARSESGNVPIRANIPLPTGMPAMDKLKLMQVSYQEAADKLASADLFTRELFAD